MTTVQEHTAEIDKSAALKKTLTIATAIMIGSVFLSRVMGLVREQVLAIYGGTHFEIDAYVTAFFIPELLNHFLAGGFLSVTFIPIYQGFIARKDARGASDCFSNLLTVGSLIFAVMIPLAIYYTPEVLGLMGSHIADPARRALTVRLTRIILPAQIFFYWGAFLSAVQMAHKRFFWPALAPLVYNLGIILGGIILGPALGVEGFAWGVLVGALAGNFFLQLPGAMKTGIAYRFRFRLTDPDLIQYVRLTVPLILGLGLTFSNEVFFRFFGSFLGEGGTASLNYALRTMMMVVAVFGQASGVAFFPFISQLAVEEQYEKMTRLLNGVLTKMTLYLIPLTGIMIALSPEIIAVLFQHGRFDASSTAATAPVLAMYLLGAFGFSAVMIINRSFYATRNTLLPMLVSTGAAVGSVPLYWLLGRAMGAPGIALAGGIAMTAQGALLYGIWLKRFKEHESTAKLVRIFLQVVVISAVGMGCAWLLKLWFAPIVIGWRPFWAHAAVASAASICGGGVIFLLYEVAGVQNIKASLRSLIRR